MSEENWVGKTIAAKSDQLNAEDLIAGPITVTIKGVKSGDGEQPVVIEIGDGRQPFKPCKTVRRVLVALWGDIASKWIGRRMTLYCDPSVKWGGVAIGGIRISHMSDITKTHTLMLSEAKAKRKAITIEPLAEDKPKPPPDEFLDGWRGKFKGMSKSVMEHCRAIASAYKEKNKSAIGETVTKVRDETGDSLTENEADLLVKFADEAVWKIDGN